MKTIAFLPNGQEGVALKRALAANACHAIDAVFVAKMGFKAFEKVQSTEDSLENLLQQPQIAKVIVLHANGPVPTAQQLAEALRLLGGASEVVAVSRLQRAAFAADGQSLPEVWEENGAFTAYRQNGKGARALYKMEAKANLPHMRPDIRLFLSDVDGVLTDASMYYTELGDELKKFNTHDGMGFNMLAKEGIKTGIITSEDTKMVERRAKKLKLDYLCQGAKFGGKLQAALDICEKEGIGMHQVAYIGDDINCIALLEQVGLAACPANATHKVKAIHGIVHLEKKGGEGAVREFIERYILCERVS